MEQVFQVSSLPLKDVIKDLAEAFEVAYSEKCEEYYLEIPPKMGEGDIRGINFDNGLGIIIYRCRFNEDVRINFTVENVHPIKYLYAVEGPVSHSFANETIVHRIDQYKCAIVASEKHIGHSLLFEKNTEIEILSLEIDREKFLINTACEVKDLVSELKQLFQDNKAEKTFYHDGFYGLEFKQLLSNTLEYKEKALIRKFYLESISLQIFVNQLIQFEDDLLKDSSQSILRLNELNRLEEISKYIQNNLSGELTIVSLSKKTGLNPNKLQKGFKHLFNTTVNEYVTTSRLSKSLILLKDPNMSIADVANAIGIESNSYFSKIFKEHFEMSPRDYQKL